MTKFKKPELSESRMKDMVGYLDFLGILSRGTVCLVCQFNSCFHTNNHTEPLALKVPNFSSSDLS